MAVRVGDRDQQLFDDVGDMVSEHRRLFSLVDFHLAGDEHLGMLDAADLTAGSPA